MKDLSLTAHELLRENPFIEKEEIEKLLGLNTLITSVTAHSSACELGCLFVAQRGATPASKDGHDYLDEAIGRGASLIIVDKVFQARSATSVPIIFSSDSRAALSYAAERFYKKPSSKLSVIGITGTNGKTSTTFMLHSILQKAGFKPRVMGTLGMGDPQALAPLSLTTMDPVFISASLLAMAKDNVSHAIMEISSHALSLKRVEALNFQVVALTNITEDHLDFHQNLANYKNAKARLFFNLASASTKKVLPHNHPFPNPKSARFFGDDIKDGVSFSNVSWSPKGTQFTLKMDDNAIRITLPCFGIFQAANATAAAAIALDLGIAHHHIVAGLSACPIIPGRLERVESGSKKLVLVDFAHTPDALRMLLSSVRQMGVLKIILVFGCGGDRDREKRPRMGEIASKLSDLVIVTDDNPRGEDPTRIRKEIKSGMTNLNRVHDIADRKEAISYAIAQAGLNDAVVIAGKGHENYQIFSGKMVPFSDYLEAKKVLDSL